MDLWWSGKHMAHGGNIRSSPRSTAGRSGRSSLTDHPEPSITPSMSPAPAISGHRAGVAVGADSAAFSVIDTALRLIDSLDAEIDGCAAALRTAGADHSYVPLLTTAPGIGAVLGAGGRQSRLRAARPAAMASRGPDRVPRPPVWLPACKVIALRLARSARPGRPSASDTSTWGTRLHRLHAGIGAGQRRG